MVCILLSQIESMCVYVFAGSYDFEHTMKFEANVTSPQSSYTFPEALENHL